MTVLIQLRFENAVQLQKKTEYRKISYSLQYKCQLTHH